MSPVYGDLFIIYYGRMSKTSHARHEHDEIQHHHEPADDYGPTFAQKHRKLIILVIILFVLFMPVAYAIYWFSRFF